MARYGKNQEPESTRLARDAQQNGTIQSYGTQNAYESALRGFVEHAREIAGYEGSLKQVPDSLVQEYLGMRSETVGQKTLDQDRQAISAITGQTYERVKADYQTTDRATEPRAYTDDQVAVIREALSEKHDIATQVAHEAGLRAHELHTLRPAEERAATANRPWSNDRFAGRENQVKYTVQGKGGLVREVSLSRETAQRLENYRREASQRVTDRKIEYRSYYAIGGGNAWTQAISRASNRMLGWSHGAHGLRHAYAQDRVKELKNAGHFRDDALRIVSQELGHFRPDITEVYLR